MTGLISSMKNFNFNWIDYFTDWLTYLSIVVLPTFAFIYTSSVDLVTATYTSTVEIITSNIVDPYNNYINTMLENENVPEDRKEDLKRFVYIASIILFGKVVFFFSMVIAVFVHAYCRNGFDEVVFRFDTIVRKTYYSMIEGFINV